MIYYWILIIGIAFIGASFCFSGWIEKKHNIRDRGGKILALIGAMLWFSFMLGLGLSSCLKG